MGKWDKFRTRLMRGQSDANIGFDDLCTFLEHLGWSRRIKGGHHLFSYPAVTEIISLQPESDGKAKAYQVRQVRALIQRLGL